MKSSLFGKGIILLLAFIMSLGSFNIASAKSRSNNAEREVILINQKRISLIENYLRSIYALESKFVQVENASTVILGEVKMIKPGKFYIKYEEPLDVTVKMDGNVALYTNHELDQSKYINIKNISFAKLLTDRNIVISTIADIEDIQETENYYEISLKMKESGSFNNAYTIIFKKKYKGDYQENDNILDYLQLARIIMIDAKKNNIVMEFTEMKVNMELDKSVFIIRNTNLNLNKRRR